MSHRSDRIAEFECKQERIQNLLVQRRVDAIVLQRASSFAWATCGVTPDITKTTSNASSTLVITPARRYLVTNKLEVARLQREEGLADQGWEWCVREWYDERNDIIAKLTRGLRLGADGVYPGAVDLSEPMARLRAALTPEEGERFRQLGHLCAEAIHATAHSIRPGQTEHEMTGRLAWEAERRGVQAIVNVVATDERVALFRHPPPTDAKLQHYAMLVLCGQRGGLICSVTRFVYFGRLPIDLRRKAEAAARVASSLIAATQPGQHLAVIFQQAMTAFAEVGFPEAWRYHHLGGAAGYEPREYFALPTSRDVVSLGQAYTWNPAIEETRSVDTILVTETGADILTAIPGWPVIPIEDHARLVLRPAILEIR